MRSARSSRDAPAHLVPGGWLLLEHGLDQGAAVRALLQSTPDSSDVETERDLEGRDRVTLGGLGPPAAFAEPWLTVALALTAFIAPVR